MRTKRMQIIVSATALSLLAAISAPAQSQHSLAENPVPVIPGLPADQQPIVVQPGRPAPNIFGWVRFVAPDGATYYYRDDTRGVVTPNTVINANGMTVPNIGTVANGATLLPNGATVSPNGVVTPPPTTAGSGTTVNGSYNYGTIPKTGVAGQPERATIRHGNSVVPVGGSPLPNGSIELPDGSIINPNGTITQPAQTVPNGQAKPSGSPTTANTTATSGTKTANGTVPAPSTGGVTVKK